MVVALDDDDRVRPELELGDLHSRLWPDEYTMLYLISLGGGALSSDLLHPFRGNPFDDH